MPIHLKPSKDYDREFSAEFKRTEEFWGNRPSYEGNPNAPWSSGQSTQVRSDQYYGRHNSTATKQAVGEFKPFTPFHRSRWTVNRPRGSYTEYYDHWSGNPNNMSVYRYTGSALIPATFASVHLAGYYPADIPINTKNRLNTDVLLKLKNGKVNIGEALAEARSTYQHLASTTFQLLSAYKAARQGNFRGVAKALGVSARPNRGSKELAGRWLEYQFGWMPLLNDIKGAYDALGDGLKRPSVIVASRKLTDSVHSDSGVNGNRRDMIDSTVEYRCKVYAKLDNTYVDAANRVGLLSPLQVAWAVVPWSFVVDWVLPVGNVLEALTATCGLEYLTGGYGTRVHYSSTSEEYVNGASMKPITGSPLRVEARLEAYARTTLGGFPWPAFHIKSPFSTSHAISALALLRQLQR